MNGDQSYHNPWRDSPQAPVDADRASGQNVRHEVLDGIQRLARSAMAWAQRGASWWSNRMSVLWRQDNMSAKLTATGLLILGLMCLLVLAYMMLYLIPLLILAAFVAAVWHAVAASRNVPHR